jgi:serine protease AprX
VDIGPNKSEEPTSQRPQGRPMPSPPATPASDEVPAAPKGLSGPDLRTAGEEVRVMVEFSPPPGEFVRQSDMIGAQFRDVGFNIDPDYEPIPMSSPDVVRSTASQDAASAPRIILRGTMPEGRIEELRRLPGVTDVYRDFPIAPFQNIDLRASPGPCPIQPCDCTGDIAKGGIAEVRKLLRVDAVHAAGLRGEGVTVGVVDGGITADGRQAKPGETSRRIRQVVGGWPASSWGTEASEWGEHGNMCATDVLSIAPLAELYDLRVAGDTESTVSIALQAFQWAIDNHRSLGKPDILTNSWGIYQEAWDPSYANDPNHIFTRQVREAIDEGILVLFAAGNCGGAGCASQRCGNDTGPGRDIWGANGHPRVMTVAAVNPRGEYIGYSSRGPAALDPNKPDFCGVSHFTGYFGSDSGTSAATPIAAGVVALLCQGRPGLSQEIAKEALSTTARDIGPIGWDTSTGAGIINAEEAMMALVGDMLPAVHLLLAVG